MKKALFISGLVITGTVCLLNSASIAKSIEYLLTPAGYPIYIEGKEFKNTDLPILNYEGNTYVPLKAVGDLTGVDVKWNEKAKKVEIQKKSAEPPKKADDTNPYTEYKSYKTVVQIDHKLYDLAFRPNIIYGNNKFYIKLDEQKINLLIAAGTRYYQVDTSDDPNVMGTIKFVKGSNVLNNFINKQVTSDYETQYTINNGSKKYNIVLHEGEDKGIIRYNKMAYIPADDLFSALGIHYIISVDNENKRIMFTLQ